MGWNPFDDGDTEKDGPNVQVRDKIRKAASEGKLGKPAKRINSRRQQTEDALKMLDL
jgi:hypothetical protein